MDSMTFDTASQLIRTLSEQLEAHRVRTTNVGVGGYTYADDSTRWIFDECEAIERARDFMINVIDVHTIPRLSKLKSRYNHTTLIYRLPFDALASVFKFVVGSDASELPRARPPLQLASVSRWWREVALGTPVLWAKIGTEAGASGDLINTFLARSNSIPLDIWLKIDDEGSDFARLSARRNHLKSHHHQSVLRILEALPPHTGRLRSLSFENIPESHGNYPLSPAPQLEVLCCVGRSIPGGICIAPTNIFGGHTPRLRDLQLNSICIHLTSPIYTGLTRLHLENIRFRFSAMHQLIRAIKEYPLLEELKLSYIVFSGEVTHEEATSLFLPSVHEPVTPAMLRRIEICPLSLAREVFMFMVVPSSSLLILPLRSNEDFNSVISQARGNLKNLVRICSLHLRCLQSTQSRRLDFSGPSYGFLGETASKSGLTLLRIPIAREGFDGPNILFPSIARFFALQIETLSLTGTPKGLYMTVNRCLAVLSALASLTKLSLESCASAGLFLKALVVTPTSHLCPRLDKLCLAYISGLDDALIGTVKSRGSLGDNRAGRLRKVTLAECPLADECIEVLKNYVQVKVTHKPFSDLGLVHVAREDEHNWRDHLAMAIHV
ncbi:hypothetical protein BOTBODRAFT_53312 [Botryobasidium botryosum FD-172 SS1]|uniref:F-box domain-containing protein n=1 Tax=Botryobasidium botryosum (strain FD-172 SS1) TaxID=930990 RepID=A0A067N0X8_BOTB1|nr:hypothetical protein BOTBODRAFT_53312 [Botryobasidium botryosum FD-172 SS1]